MDKVLNEKDLKEALLEALLALRSLEKNTDKKQDSFDRAIMLIKNQLEVLGLLESDTTK